MGFQEFELDLDGDLSTDFTIRRLGWFNSFGSYTCTWQADIQVVPGALAAVENGFSSSARGPDPTLPAALLAGDSIGTAQSFGAANGLLAQGTGSLPSYNFNTTGNFVGRYEDRYLGLKFSLTARFTSDGSVSISTSTITLWEPSRSWIMDSRRAGAP